MNIKEENWLIWEKETPETESGKIEIYILPTAKGTHYIGSPKRYIMGKGGDHRRYRRYGKERV